MKRSTYFTLILSVTLLASCTVGNSTSPSSSDAPTPPISIASTNSTEPPNAPISNEHWIFTTKINKMHDTTERRLQSTSLGGDREYEITAYCDDFQMGLTLNPKNFDINEINWQYGLPGFSAEFIKVGIRAGDSNASTFALKTGSVISVLLNSREYKDYLIILDRPNTLAEIESDTEFRKITKSLFEYLQGTLGGNKLLFNGVFPDETIEFSPPNESTSVHNFMNSCDARIKKFYSNTNSATEAAVSIDESPETEPANNITRLTEIIIADSLEASDGGDGFYFRTTSGRSYSVTSNADEMTQGADLIQDAATNKLPLCLSVSGDDLIKIDSGACN